MQSSLLTLLKNFYIHFNSLPYSYLFFFIYFNSCVCFHSGIRLHFHKFVKGLTELNASKAQLGLGHSYSRCKVKFNVNRADNMIIQSINLLDQLDKDINTFSMRCRYL